MLESTGIYPDEERVYRALVGTPSATVEELSRASGIGGGRLQGVLGSLLDRDLVSRVGDDPPSYAAAPPEIAMEALILTQQHQLAQARIAAASLQQEYVAARRGGLADDLVEVLMAPGAIVQRFDQVQRGARSEVLALVKPPFLAPGDFGGIQRDQLERGITYRTVYDHAGFEAQEGFDALARDVEAGEEARVCANVPMKLFVVDRSLAFAPLNSPTEEERAGAILVHASGLLDALVSLFEVTWNRAAPLALVHGGKVLSGRAALPATDARLLAMLRAGLTDDAIGKHLDVSVRTVHRRIRRLMDVTGSETRFQLGWRATQLGWLDPVDGDRFTLER